MTNSDGESNGGGVRAELKKLLETILTSVDYASEDQQESLLGSLRDWQRGERRKHGRRDCSIPVRVGTWRVFTEHIRNISKGGVFIKTAAPFSRGEHLTLIFSLPNKNGPVKITGHVVWSSSDGVGVEFTEALTGEMKGLIDAL